MSFLLRQYTQILQQSNESTQKHELLALNEIVTHLLKKKNQDTHFRKPALVQRIRLTFNQQSNHEDHPNLTSISNQDSQLEKKQILDPLFAEICAKTHLQDAKSYWSSKFMTLKQLISDLRNDTLCVLNGGDSGAITQIMKIKGRRALILKW